MNQTELTRHHRALELDKILTMLAEEAPCAACAELARALTPTSDVEEATHRLAQTSDAHMLMGRFGSPSFGAFHDPTGPLTRAAAGASLSMRELLNIAETLRVIRGLGEWRAHCEGVRTGLDYLFEGLAPNKHLENRIGECIISEDEMADTASPALRDIRRKIANAAAQVRERLDKMVRSVAYQKYLQDPIVTIRSERFVLPVKAEYRNEIPGLVHDTSSSGSTVFIEPIGVVEAGNEVKVLKSKEAAEIERILLLLSGEVGSFAASISESYRAAVTIGFIFTKARLAYKMKASCPIIDEDGITLLRKARHPLIDPAHVVPTDIRLGGDFDTLVITGPNTGGKTVALKTIGLLTLMAMCGLMIPAGDQSRVSVFDHVLSDIGDEQSIEQSLSTFSAHMTNIIAIIERADNKSLVLLDELGAGTDPVEGAALAMSIIEHLREKGVRLAATTHYAELKAYALQTPGVENGCCEFDVATLRPTYRLLIGVPGRSNAFAISERLGMPSSVVDHARELVSSEDTRFEDVVQKLEQSRQSMEAQQQEAERLRITAEQAARNANEKLSRIERESEREIERARTQARTLVEQTRRQAEEIISELEALKREKDADDFAARAREAKAALRQKLHSMEDAADPVAADVSDDDYTLPRPLRIGDAVHIRELGAKGVVASLPDAHGQIAVQAGIIKTRVPQASLRLIEAPKAKPHRTVTRSVASAAEPVKVELDLRGKTADEALAELDQFIDKSVLRGVDLVTVIHGKGTGALRTAVQTYLRAHKSVRSFRLGGYGEGDTGVTIIELK